MKHLKRKKKNVNFKFYFITVYVIINLAVYYALLIYCDTYNTKNSEKITAASLTLNGGDIQFKILSNGYVIETNKIDFEKTLRYVYYFAPGTMKLATEFLAFFEKLRDY